MFEELLKKDEPTVATYLAELGFPDGTKACRVFKRLLQTPLKERLHDVMGLSLGSPHPDSAVVNLERVVTTLADEQTMRWLMEGEHLERLILLCGASPYLVGLVLQNVAEHVKTISDEELGRTKDRGLFLGELSGLTEGVRDEPTLARISRRYRNREYIRIGTRELTGKAPIEDVFCELSGLAEATLEVATEFVLKELEALYGIPLYEAEDGSLKRAEFCVIGLGKLGGRELNFLSDIDIIYIYSSDRGSTTGGEHSSLTLHEFFSKVAERVTRLVSAITEDGFTFRVDLNLRPEGRSGDIVNSVRSAEIYYESWGQTWERAAMIKARPVAGSHSLAERFIQMIQPFVYRRYLDFTAIEEIRHLKARMDIELLRKRQDRLDVKLGRGGIREIEFFCQALQLIYGGRYRTLRTCGTLETIDRLVERGLLSEQDGMLLRESYIFLRRVEHRLQIVHGTQTQALPRTSEELTRVARMLGFRGKDELWQQYHLMTESVHHIYNTLFYGSEEELKRDIPDDVLLLLSGETTDEEMQDILKRLGFEDPESPKRVRLLRDGAAFLRLPERARLLRERILPYIIMRASEATNPDMALLNMERFISSVGARTTLYSLLSENPSLMRELIKIFGSSTFLSNTIIAQPESLDILLSEEMAIPYKEKDVMRRELASMLSETEDYEHWLDILRRYKKLETFRLGIQHLAGTLSPEGLSEELTILAELSLEAALDMAMKTLGPTYGFPRDRRFAIIGLGKLGGRELIYGSDLDIIFVYGDEGGHTDGPKTITDHEFYVKCAQKIISMLSVRTKEGIVFSIDTRLRPTGSSGPLVVSKSSFLRYHREKAQLWERQAAIRARFVAGKAEFGQSLAGELKDIIFSRPLGKEDVDELLRIRGRMEEELARETPERFDIKTGRGGLVDIEFVVQTLQLHHGWKLEVLRVENTLTALKELRNSGILTSGECQLLLSAYSFYRQIELTMRVVHDTPVCVIKRGSPLVRALVRRLGYTDEEEFMEYYLEKREAVRRLYMERLERIKKGAG